MTKKKTHKWTAEYFHAYVEESIKIAEERDPAYKAERAARRAQIAKDEEFEKELGWLPYFRDLPADAEIVFSHSVGG